jgi:hypothetical protein
LWQNNMSGFSFTLPNGKAFEIKGPPGLTKEQAQAIFDQQAKTGALVGFKPGDILSAATQSSNGLIAAQAQVGQALSGITGALGAGIPGAAGAIGKLSSSAAAAGGALSGSLAETAAGLTGAVGPAVSSITGAVTGTVRQLGSVATQAISTINKTITSTSVTSPIDVANFAKQVPALTSIASMSQPDVTGVLAQAKNIVGQGAAVLSDVKGAGAFGLNVGQLETAGILKPGTSALAQRTGASISSILKSPAVYTGKDGIKSVDNILSNVPKQAEIQQTLMAKGLGDLAAVGMPISNLSAQGVAGVALSAAKSVPNTENLLKNLPVSPDVKAEFDTVVRDAAFAVNLTETKVPDVYKAVDTPVPAKDTTNRETVDAATNRVLGNDKIPEPNYGSSTSSSLADDAFIDKFSQLYADLLNNIINVAGRGLTAVQSKINALQNQQTITSSQWDAINSEYQNIKTTYNTQAPAKIIELNAFVESGTSAQQRLVQASFQSLKTSIDAVLKLNADVKQQVNLLTDKIQGASS